MPQTTHMKPKDYFSLGKIKVIPGPSKRSPQNKHFSQNSNTSLDRKKYLTSENPLPKTKILSMKNRTRFPSISELNEIELKKLQMKSSASQKKLKEHAQYVIEQSKLIPDNKGKMPTSPARVRYDNETAHERVIRMSQSTWTRARRSVD